MILKTAYQATRYMKHKIYLINVYRCSMKRGKMYVILDNKI